MTWIIVSFVILLLGGCSSSSTPNVNLDMESVQMTMMQRGDVINAIEECRSVDLRPVMIKSKIKVNNHPTAIIIDVTCATSSMFKRK